jgi:DNA-binding NarL/FixJ family response regulator
MTEEIIRVVIADDHDLFRDGLRGLLDQQKNIDVVAEARTGRQLVDMVKRLKPDVALTDLVMPEMDGIDAIKAIADASSTVKCIVISSYDSDELIVDALEAGAMGYIIKNAERGAIIEAIKTVSGNNPYYCPSTSLKLAKKISKSCFRPQGNCGENLFSDREKDIIRLICEGKTSQEIGKTLYIGHRTVERIRSIILGKMNVKNAPGLVIYAMQNGIYEPPQ